MRYLTAFVIACLAWLMPFDHAKAAERCFPGEFSLPAFWTRSYEPHRVIGNLYAVGNAGLSAYLITTDEGHILVNTMLEGSMQEIKTGVEALGFRMEDIRVLLTTQAHFDHTADLAKIKALTGAEMYATPDDARVLEDGGASDAHFGHCQEFLFTPIKVERRLADGETFTLGDVTITTHHHPGHTEGSSSYSWQVTENGKKYNVAIVNMGTINDGKQLLIEPTYAGVAEDFAMTFHKQRQMNIDVWVSSHPQQYHLTGKHKPGQPYDPETFVDPEGFLAEVNKLAEIYKRQLDNELAESAAMLP